VYLVRDWLPSTEEQQCWKALTVKANNVQQMQCEMRQHPSPCCYPPTNWSHNVTLDASEPAPPHRIISGIASPVRPAGRLVVFLIRVVIKRMDDQIEVDRTGHRGCIGPL